MLNLIKNEYVKVLKKKSTVIWLVILFILSLGLLYLTTNVDMDNMYYEHPYMSEEFVASELANREEKTSDYDMVLEKVKELGMYSKDNVYYSALFSAYEVFPLYPSEENSTTKPKLNEENKKKFDEAAAAIDAGDSDKYLALMAANYKTVNYTFKGSDNTFANPYKYCIDNKIDAFKDSTLMSYVNIVVNLENTLESTSNSSNGSSNDQKKDYNSYLIYSKLLKDKQSDAIIGQDVSYDTNNQYASMSTPDGMTNNYTNDSNSSKFWQIMQGSSSYVTLIEILMLIIAGSCVASEFSNGTIKFLLINPVSRRKIITSKYCMLLSFSFICVTIYFAICILFGMIIGGIGDLGACYITASDGTVTSFSAFLFVAKQYLFAYIDIICYGTLAFMLSSLFRNSAIAIGISIALSISGNIITMMLSSHNFDWGRYLLFSNTDLNTIQTGNSLFPNQTVGFAAVVIIVHLAVFLLTAYDGFTRREV